jgi:hypothetical protein
MWTFAPRVRDNPQNKLIISIFGAEIRFYLGGNLRNANPTAQNRALNVSEIMVNILKTNPSVFPPAGSCRQHRGDLDPAWLHP